MSYSVPLHKRITRAAMRFAFRGIFHLLCNVRIISPQNIPSQGAYIVAHNHISLFEPPFVLSFWPHTPEAIAGADVFDRPWQKYMVRAYAAIPVHRGAYDRKVIDTMLNLLDQGMPLVIAPEGGRSHNVGMRRAHSGIAYIAARAQVPVLPVGIYGSTEDMLARALRLERPLLEMRIGQPFYLPAITGRGKARRQSRQQNADLVMNNIARLLPESYHGVYSGAVPLS